MTPQQQNEAIAKAVGWKVEFKANPWDETDPEEKKWEVTQPNGWSSRRSDLSAIPSYTTDLNAMHEAEKILGFVQRRNYAEKLHTCFRDQETHMNYYELDFLVANSTASQRAEAFLRTLGLWKEEA